MASPKDQLVEFLESEVFNPILRADPEDFSGADRDKLQHVQDATRAEIDRFRGYGSADEVVTNFKRDLSSQPAKRIHQESRDLGLPTLNGVRNAFEQKASELGV